MKGKYLPVGLFFVLLMGFSGCDVTGQNADDAKNQRMQTLLFEQDKLNEYVKAGDVSKCVDFEMEQFRESCEANILAKSAVSAQDTVVCQSASTESVREKCEQVVVSNIY